MAFHLGADDSPLLEYLCHQLKKRSLSELDLSEQTFWIRAFSG